MQKNCRTLYEMSDFATVTYLLRASAAQGPGPGTRAPQARFPPPACKTPSPDKAWDPLA